jgi:fructokinase
MAAASLFAGVELGGTKCIALLASGPDEVLARETVPTATPDETLGRIEQILSGWRSGHNIAGLGVASFGPLDLEAGSIASTPKPGWAGADVRGRLSGALGVPAVFDTDVNGAALAELRWGSGWGMRDFAYITVGTGIGVGLVVDGKPTRGFGHCELGHARVSRSPGDDFAGSCPFHGDCVEGLASGTALRARVGDRVAELGPDDPVWDSVAAPLAHLCLAIVCAAAPRAIAIGGGVMEGQPHLLGRIERLLVDSLNGYVKLPEAPYLRAPALGRDAGPLGAIALAVMAERS